MRCVNRIIIIDNSDADGGGGDGSDHEDDDDDKFKWSLYNANGVFCVHVWHHTGVYGANYHSHLVRWRQDIYLPARYGKFSRWTAT